MELLDSLKWAILSQRLYRLAVFRTANDRAKLVTDNWEIFWSVLYIGIIAAQVCYIGQIMYFRPSENFFQINVGECEEKS